MSIEDDLVRAVTERVDTGASHYSRGGCFSFRSGAARETCHGDGEYHCCCDQPEDCDVPREYW